MLDAAWQARGSHWSPLGLQVPGQAFLVPGRAGIDGGSTEAAEVSRDQPATTRVLSPTAVQHSAS